MLVARRSHNPALPGCVAQWESARFTRDLAEEWPDRPDSRCFRGEPAGRRGSWMRLELGAIRLGLGSGLGLLPKPSAMALSAASRRALQTIKPGPPPDRSRARREIGRASCRERV